MFRILEIRIVCMIIRWSSKQKVANYAELDGLQQPLLKNFDPNKVGNELFTRDFSPRWYKGHSWRSYEIEG